jgi:hypothetical protein
VKKIFAGIAAAITTLCLLCFPQPVAAVVTETTGDLQVTAEHPMFSESELWYPGLALSKTLTIKNIGSRSHTPAIEAVNTSDTVGLADILGLQIFENSTPIFGAGDTKHMSDFWNAGTITLAPLGSGEASDIQVTVAMPDSADNGYQHALAKFDLNIGFVGTEDQIVVGGGSPPAGAGDGLSDGRSDGLSDGRSDGRSSAPLAYGGIGAEILGAQTQQEGSGSAPSPTPTPTQTPAPNGQVLGQRTNFSGMYIVLWFLILLLLALLLWILLRKRRDLLK